MSVDPGRQRLRSELREIRPYGAPQLDVPVRLNVNENPYGISEAIKREMLDAVSLHLDSINRYPDREAELLRSKLARYLGHGLSPDQVWAANGSNEVMIQILQCYAGPGRSLLTFPPTYSMYPEYARTTHTRYLEAPRKADFGLDFDLILAMIHAENPDVILLANPNNPTGTALGLAEISRILQMSEAILVVDEAYQEFSSEPSAVEMLPSHPNLIVCRTMSKAFAFAGGRIGYAAASESVVEALRVVRLPYHLNAITQALACVGLDHAEDLLAQVDHLRHLRDQSIARARRQGLDVVDSQTNFFLCGPFADAHAVWKSLLDHGVLVRETGPKRYLRISVGTDEEMERFHDVLTQVHPELVERSTQ